LRKSTPKILTSTGGIFTCGAATSLFAAKRFPAPSAVNAGNLQAASSLSLNSQVYTQKAATVKRHLL
jgi:hypothetical protein